MVFIVVCNCFWKSSALSGIITSLSALIACLVANQKYFTAWASFTIANIYYRNSISNFLITWNFNGLSIDEPRWMSGVTGR
ncbi:Os02g0293350 [Oryza sativa Japonica Group]|jgi:Na+/H+ antiporter NhaA|uniref:Os02g0293350 protein n=1 Tax=Oryza sativa subsp. japonica TaxID=39947 RepID=A0A0P0VHU1_ORYSJ|nr:hypothetical protein EE612_010577 [Oryza sativa]BAS78204.1 Os02g0293350 [Oryza sativa Japonica Group]